MKNKNIEREQEENFNFQSMQFSVQEKGNKGNGN